MKRIGILLLAIFPNLALADWVSEGWLKDLVTSATLLREARYDRALKVASRVTTEMAEDLTPGREATEAFGLAITHKALALAGLGQSEDALWYWHTAIALYPSFARSDLSAFGSAGAFLKEHVTPRGPICLKPTSDPPQISEPKAISQPQPKFPEGARQSRVTGDLVVDVVITKDGTVTSPRVTKALPAATLSYAALEAVKRWRYEPARVDGAPTEVSLTVTVHYTLTR